MKTIKILQVNGAMNLGGTDVMIMNLFRNMDRNLYEFDFLYYTAETSYFDDEIIKLGGKIIRTSSPTKGSYFRLIKNLRRVIKENGPYDVIHIHTMLNSGLVALAAYKEGIPVRIVHSHSTQGGDSTTLLYKTYEKLMKNAIRKYATDFVGCGKEAAVYLFGKRLLEKKVVIIPNSINLERYIDSTALDPITIKEALGIPLKKKVVAQIGAFKDVKNHIFTLDIIKKIKQKNKDLVFIFIGEGPNKKEIESKIKENKLEEFVKIVGQRDDVPEILSMVDLVIMPSLYEGIPISLIEAQASNVLSLASDNISNEVDLNMGLINFIKLDIDLWENEIYSSIKSPLTLVSNNRKRQIFEEKGYSLNATLTQIKKLYR